MPPGKDSVLKIWKNVALPFETSQSLFVVCFFRMSIMPPGKDSVLKIWKNIPIIVCCLFLQDVNNANSKMSPFLFSCESKFSSLQPYGVSISINGIHLIRSSLRDEIHQTISLNSLAIRLQSQDLKHLIPGNGVPELQGQHIYVTGHPYEILS